MITPGTRSRNGLLLSRLSCGAAMRLSLSCRTDVVNQSLTVLLDGKEIYREPLARRTEFTPLEIPLPIATAGQHELTLRYGAFNAASESRQLAILFERLQVLPVSEK